MKDRITAGLAGDYEGLNNGLNRINDYIFGIQRSCYTLYGGGSGSGKTTLIDYQLLCAIEDAESKNITINIIYYSWEIDELTKKANWLSVLIYKKYGITIPPEKIKGLGKFRLTDDEQQLVFSEIPEVERIFNKINWIWQPLNPTGCYKYWWEFMKTRGTFKTEPYVDENDKPQERIVSFELNDPTEYNIVVMDHVSLAKLERGFSLKQNLDKLSELTVSCRNMFKMTFLYLQQFNNQLSSIDRMKFKGADISPQQTDFRDSGNLYIDSDIALGLMNAYKMDMDTCMEYNINRPGSSYNLKESFRMLKIVKNRLSRDNLAIGLLFLPKSGSFKELPEPHLINNEWITQNLK